MPLRGFSSTAVLPTLKEAFTRAGLSSDGAELLRLGENAIYQLAADPVVVRIARSADRLPRVQRELCVARWLAASSTTMGWSMSSQTRTAGTLHVLAHGHRR
jgi:hypothetical protein